MKFWPLNDQITVSFVRAAGVLAKGRMRPAGRMFDMPALHDKDEAQNWDLQTRLFSVKPDFMSLMCQVEIPDNSQMQKLFTQISLPLICSYKSYPLRRIIKSVSQFPYIPLRRVWPFPKQPRPILFPAIPLISVRVFTSMSACNFQTMHPVVFSHNYILYFVFQCIILRCATSRTVPASIPGAVTGDCFHGTPDRTMGPEVDW